VLAAAPAGCACVGVVVTDSFCGWFCGTFAATAATFGAGSDEAFAGIGFSDIRSSSLLVSILGACGLTMFEINTPPPRPTTTAATTVPTPAKYAVEVRIGSAP
jgi:hypothetical protein